MGDRIPLLLSLQDEHSWGPTASYYARNGNSFVVYFIDAALERKIRGEGSAPVAPQIGYND